MTPRDSSFFDDGIDDKLWVDNPGERMIPQISGTEGDFKTSLFDVTQGSQEVKWGGLGTLGVETENHSLALTYFYTHSAEDTATLAEDTRGKAYFFPGYDVDDPTAPGNQQRDAAPYLRTETLEYTERTTHTIQLSGCHKLPVSEFELSKSFKLLSPELDWTAARSFSGLDQPDKRQFGSKWFAERYNEGFPPWLEPWTDPAVHSDYKPAANFTMGNFQRIWKDISEESDQYFVNLKLPFEQWTGDEGYLKFGVFNDRVNREFNQDSFSNFSDPNLFYYGPFSDYWSEHFPSENHPMAAANVDVDYRAEQNISAWYYMADLPLTNWFKLIGGVRYETTELSIVNDAESDADWIPPGAASWVDLNPGDADVSFEQKDMLPSIGFEYKPFKDITLRGSYSETIARQTFKELTPIQQQEYLGGDVFIGNPGLQMSSLKNYDLRLDWTPYDGGLVSLSYFYKDIKDPIEYVQRIVNNIDFTTPINYAFRLRN